MPSKPKATKASSPRSTDSPEADFNDTIAANRGLKLLDPSTVPHPPPGYRATNADERARRIRRLAAELRSEAMDALREAAGRDLQAELGRFAPESKRAVALVDRLTTTGELVARAQTLLDYAKESDQIAMSDALVFLEAERKQYENAVEHEASLSAHYRALVKLFDMRSGAIADGMARARSAGASSSPGEPPSPPGEPASPSGEPPRGRAETSASLLLLGFLQRYRLDALAVNAESLAWKHLVVQLEGCEHTGGIRLQHGPDALQGRTLSFSVSLRWNRPRRYTGAHDAGLRRLCCGAAYRFFRRCCQHAHGDRRGRLLSGSARADLWLQGSERRDQPHADSSLRRPGLDRREQAPQRRTRPRDPRLWAERKTKGKHERAPPAEHAPLSRVMPPHRGRELRACRLEQRVATLGGELQVICDLVDPLPLIEIADDHLPLPLVQGGQEVAEQLPRPDEHLAVRAAILRDRPEPLLGVRGDTLRGQIDEQLIPRAEALKMVAEGTKNNRFDPGLERLRGIAVRERAMDVQQALLLQVVGVP